MNLLFMSMHQTSNLSTFPSLIKRTGSAISPYSYYQTANEKNMIQVIFQQSILNKILFDSQKILQIDKDTILLYLQLYALECSGKTS
jgi:hypothetical protein